MSQPLNPVDFPLYGARLIEASAGTGKTWTIAALYLRLVLGHGEDAAYQRPLAPAEILVMTFTKAATKELSDRIRERLVQAAGYFRGERQEKEDSFLQALAAAYPEDGQRSLAAHRLMLAAEAMDDAAIFTIDAWCQRMLREHAFDSGCLFDEELISSEKALLGEATRDYWRRHVYPLAADAYARVEACWPDLATLEKRAAALVDRAHLFTENADEALGELITRSMREQADAACARKAGWGERAQALAAWLAKNKKSFDGRSLPQKTIDKCISTLQAWAAGEAALPDEDCLQAWESFPGKVAKACKDSSLALAHELDELQELVAALQALDFVSARIKRHVARGVALLAQQLKEARRQFGFADMLARLKDALEEGNGSVLARRIVTQYPVALVDEFQDTSPDQYRILNRLYSVADNRDDTGLFLIGDPKQAIYGFRGADIHSYLAARSATEGRHYRLGTNYRSTKAFVEAVNHLFAQAEREDGAHPAGAFRFRRGAVNPVPFEAVDAAERAEQLVTSQGCLPALTIWCHNPGELKADELRAYFAALCAEQIVTLLNDPEAGFNEEGRFTRLRPADIAILVHSRTEAGWVREALKRRKVRSVYLSDKDSVFESDEAADVLRWLRAVAAPLDGSLARAAFATRSAQLSLDELAVLASDDEAWEARVEQLKAWRQVWQKQGVLAMLRRFMQELALPARLLPDGERELTNLLHLAELLEAASQQVDGEQGLIQWLAARIADESESSDEHILRLESDARLVKVVTIHKSKGLEYPLVFLPYAVSARVVERKGRDFLEYIDEKGQRQVDFARSAASLEAADAARLDEDLRLLYVALTRARHALWMGAATTGHTNICKTALGYLLNGGTSLSAEALLPAVEGMCSGCPSIKVEQRLEQPSCTPLRPDADAETGTARSWRPPVYEADFERRWSIASYTSITRDAAPLLSGAPVLASAQEEKLLDQDDVMPAPAAGEEAPQDAPWHRFPRGSLPGQFMHAQLEWLANAGFASVQREDFAQQVAERCERAGWRKRREDVAAWLTAIAGALLPPLGQSLSGLARAWPEMEFWVPASGMQTASLDRLCQAQMLNGRARPALQERQLRGMLRGFKDLVFEHGGRYWVLDYKSNSLGSGDGAYHEDALAEAMAGHRYDVQGMIYLLALHRLLKSRLGPDYAPEEQLGGAIFYFLRGVGNTQTRGCYLLRPDAALLDMADALLPQTLPDEQAA